MIVIPKNSIEEFRVSMNEYRGMTLLNVRVWYRTADGEMRPGKQGVALRPESALALVEAKGVITLDTYKRVGGGLGDSNAIKWLKVATS